MKNTPMLIIGIVLLVLGAVGLGWQQVTCTTRETIVDVGPVKVTADTEKEVPITPILGGVAIAGGIALIAVGARKG